MDATLSPSTSATRTHTDSNQLAIRPLAKALGSRNIFTATTADQMPKHVACGHMFGHPATIPAPETDRTHFLLMLGANPLESNGSLATAPDWRGRLEAPVGRCSPLLCTGPHEGAHGRFGRELEESHYDLAFPTLSLRDYATYTPAIHGHTGLSEFEAIVAWTRIAAGLGAAVDLTALSEAALPAQIQRAVTDTDSPIHGRDADEITKELAVWQVPERFVDLMIRIGSRGDAFGAVPDSMPLDSLSGDAVLNGIAVELEPAT